jgi:hypothetical protein
MSKLLTLSVSISLLFFSSGTMACDDKPCETAYLSATSQYIANHGRQANTARTEREVHASNRQRRDYALQNHIHQTRYFSSNSK